LLTGAYRGFKAILRRSLTVRVVEDVDEVVLSAAEAKALVAGDPDVLKRVQLQTDIHKLEALGAAHLDQQVQARWELKRLPQRISGRAWRRSPPTWHSGMPMLRKPTLQVTSPLASSSTGACSLTASRLHRYCPPPSFAAPKLR